MSKHINYCKKCDLFSMLSNCPKCNTEIHQTIPAKYSPEDKYAKYRRMAKENLEK